MGPPQFSVPGSKSYTLTTTILGTGWWFRPPGKPYRLTFASSIHEESPPPPPGNLFGREDLIERIVSLANSD